MTDVPFRCSCGQLQGMAKGVSPAAGNHCVCYCTDCQCFAHFLEREDEILDAHGGTAVFQLSAASVSIDQGEEFLACMRLSPKGLMRWYASCCNSPVANTLESPALPFAGMIMPVFEAQPEAKRQQVFGPVRARVNAHDAKGDWQGQGLHEKFPLGLTLRFMRLAMKWRLQGAARHSLFHDNTVQAKILTHEQRDALKNACDRRSS